MRKLGAPLLSGLPLLFVALFFRGSFAVLFTGYVTLLVCALVSLSLGLLASFLTRRTSTSVMLSYVLTIIVFGGITFLCIFFERWLVTKPSPPGPSGDTFGAHFLSPIAAFWANYCYYREWRHGASLINLYWFGNVVAFVLFSLGIIRLCVARFARVGMRDR